MQGQKAPAWMRERGWQGALMDLNRILSELHSELLRIEQEILCLERFGRGATEAGAQSETEMRGLIDGTTRVN